MKNVILRISLITPLMLSRGIAQDAPGIPDGSYQSSCTQACGIKGSALYANCVNEQGTCNNSVVADWYEGGIENTNGILQVTGIGNNKGVLTAPTNSTTCGTCPAACSAANVSCATLPGKGWGEDCQSAPGTNSCNQNPSVKQGQETSPSETKENSPSEDERKSAPHPNS